MLDAEIKNIDDDIDELQGKVWLLMTHTHAHTCTHSMIMSNNNRPLCLAHGQVQLSLELLLEYYCKYGDNSIIIGIFILSTPLTTTL